MGEPFETGKSYWLPLGQVEMGGFALREKIEGPEFEELKQSMAERGQLQPAVIQVFKGTTTDDNVSLLIGHRRFQAARELGWDKIWCTPIFGAGDFVDLANALVENIQRQNLLPLDEARAIKKLKETVIFSGPGLTDEAKQSLTQDEIAKGLGKRQPYISEMLQIAALTEEDLAKLSESDKIKKDKLLQLVKSRQTDRKTQPKHAPEPFRYRFDGDVIFIQGRININKDDLNLLVEKLTELIEKIKGAQTR